jgi:glycosyltransferase involved in cell wall biosynthesis
MTTDAVGGVFTYSVALATAFAREGVAVHLATMGPPPQPEQRARALAVPGLVLHESSFALEWMDNPWEDVAQAGRWLRALADEIRPDVVQVNGYAHGAVDVGAPVVVVAHSCVLSWWHAVLGEAPPPRYDAYRRAVTSGLRAADAVVAISGAMRAALVRHYGPLPAVEVVHNGLPGDDDLGAERPPAAKEPFVLTCGRLWDRAKNVEALVRVAPRLRWPVRIAGWAAPPGGTSAGDRRPNVEPLGWLGAADLGAWMDRAAVFALPALYEPFGLSVLEAASRGAALVLGDIPSLREIWGRAALFVDPRDDRALEAAVQRLISDAELRTKLAAEARERSRRYRVSRTAAEMLRVYDVARGRSPRTMGEPRACA